MVDFTRRTSRLATNASHTMNTIRITAVREINEPMEDTVFQVV